MFMYEFGVGETQINYESESESESCMRYLSQQLYENWLRKVICLMYISGNYMSCL